MWKALDPRAPDFAQKVEDLLSELDWADTEQQRQKMALLTFLAERGLTPATLPAYPRLLMEVEALLNRYDEGA